MQCSSEGQGWPRSLPERTRGSRAASRHHRTVYDSGETEGQLYLVCEFVDGETLADLLRRERPLGPETALALVLADTLSEALAASLRCWPGERLLCSDQR